MALDTAVLLGSLAAIIGLGYLGSLLFAKTRIPDILLLIGLGLVLGPVARILDPAVFLAIAPTLGTFALLIILFDGGLSLKLQELVRGLPRATLLAVSGWLLTAAAVGATLAYVFGWDFRVGLLLGALVGGSSSIAVIPLAQRMGAPEGVRVALSLESALTDVLVVVGTLTLTGMVLTGQGDVRSFAEGVVGDFSVAIVAGVAVGAMWVVLWSRLERAPYAYMVTLAVVLLLHLGVETLGGAGPIAVLAFGILLGNRRAVLRRWVSGAWELGGEMRRFHGEMAFFIRAFFFVGLGILVDPAIFADRAFLVLAGAVLAAILAARLLAVGLSTLGSAEFAGQRGAMFVLLPRGLAAAVLAAVPAQRGIAGAEAFVALAFAVIVGTNLFTTVGTALARRGPAPAVEPTLPGEVMQAREQADIAAVGAAAAASGEGPAEDAPAPGRAPAGR